jgi:hypothetical protein
MEGPSQSWKDAFCRANYTAIARGANNITGIAVVEVYALN